MKKSKFLKKSLAMLLALMLVVAMIPLSAAAAAPDVTQINVFVDGKAVATLDEGETSYEGSIANTAEEFQLEVLTDDGAEVYYVDNVNNSAAKEKALTEDPSVDNKWTSDDINIHDFSNGADTFTIEIHVYDENDKNDPDVYTITLTREAVSVDNSIKNLILETIPANGETAVPQLGYSMPNENTISIIMPYGSGDEYRIKTLDVATGATATPGKGATVKDGDTITVTAGGQVRKYTLDITVASGFKSFETEEGLDAIVFPNDNAIAVLLPYGYSTDPANVKKDVDGHKYFEITPVFEKDYESATVSYDVDDPTYDADIEKLTSGTKVIVPQEFVWGRTDYVGGAANQGSWLSFKKLTTDVRTWEAYKETYGEKDWDKFVSVFTNPAITAAYDQTHTANLELTYVEGTTRDYDVYFFETQQNNEAAIHELTIGSETAEIDGKDINITLPSNVNAAALDLTGASNHDATKLGIVASGNAKISFPAQNDVKVETAEASNTHSTTEKFQAKTGTDTLNATSTVILRVTSEDGLTTTNYNLNVTVSDNYEAPAITSMNLQSPDGKTMPVKFDSSSNTYTFTVPYSVNDKDDLKGYKLFYSKTLGATVTGADGNAFPKSGANVNTDADYIPVPGKVVKGKAIVVTSMKGNSVEKDEFFIVINRDNGSTNAVLKDFTLTNSRDPDKVDRTWGGKLEGNTFNVNVSWTGYEYWKNEGITYGSTYVTEDESAKLYWVSKNGKTLTRVVPVVEDDDLNTVGMDPNPTGWDYNTDDNIGGLIVLSEKLWVDLGERDRIFSWDPTGKTGFKTYGLNFNQLKAEEKTDFESITLLDGSGWSDDLKIDVSNNLISGSVPYSFTSGNSPASEVKIYLDYKTADNARVFSYDNDSTGTKKVTSSTIARLWNTVPTAKAVFADNGGVSDAALYEGAYMILRRVDDDKVVDNEVRVEIYAANGQEITESRNQLLVVNEDAGLGGTGEFDPFTLKLTYDEPNTEAIFTSFSVGGERGVIDQKNHTITVTLPYGTEYTYLVPTYDVSDYATVTVDDPALNGKPLRSGVTSVNFTSPRQFTVHAENEDHYTTYDVIIKVGERFSDVNPGDWFYENVMNAAAKDYVSGMGDGTFQPNGNTTRAQFASMIAKAMGFDPETDEIDVETAFVDVPATHWGAKAIAFCAENGYMNGDADGNFRPDANITRQEVASVLVNTFKLTNEGTKDFPDDALIASWAKSNVYAAKAAGLMNGDQGTGNFRPTDYIKRAESASIMMNAFNKGYLK